MKMKFHAWETNGFFKKKKLCCFFEKNWENFGKFCVFLKV